MNLARVQALAAELEAQGSAKANNAVQLIGVLVESRDLAAIRAAIQGLKLFFVDTSQEGDLGAKRHKDDFAGLLLNGAEAGGSEAGSSSSPEDVYRQWLRRQYSAYTAALLGLLKDEATPPGAQISSASALMEAVRCEQGVGAFASGLYLELITVLVTSAAVKPEVLTFLFTRYFQYADVRYYTLWAVREIALARSSAQGKGKQANGAGAKQQQQPQQEEAGAAGSSGNGAATAGPEKRKGKAAAAAAGAAAAAAAPAATAGTVKSQRTALKPGSEAAPEDVARSLFDVLANVPETIEAPSSSTGDQMEAAGPEEEGGAGGMRSWCGLEEAGALRPAPHKSEGAKARRKRRAQEQEQGAAAAGQRASWANVKAHKRMFSDAWLSFLQLPLPSDILRKVLLRLHSAVIPNLVNPLHLSDFLTFTLNQVGMTGMLALNGIFVLVTQHGLEYPNFYARLYQLITADAFAAKHRAQFFKLADLFLSSGLVPAYTVAAFAKKMARLGLSAPPAGAMTAVAFVHNLIRRHPACMVLLDRPVSASQTRAAGAGGDDDGEDGGAEGAGVGEDVFDEAQPDPAKSRAVESSLWELACLRNHYCPQVSALCAVLDKDLTNRAKTSEVDVDPLLATSYGALFKQEVERRLKQVPLAFYRDKESPTKLFDMDSQADFEGWVL